MNESGANSRSGHGNSEGSNEQDAHQHKQRRDTVVGRDSSQQSSDETVKPRNASPQRRALVAQPTIPMSPSMAAQVPLPPSPIKAPNKSAAVAPMPSRLSQPPTSMQQPSPSSLDYDRAFQKSLADDLKFLNLGPKEAFPAHKENLNKQLFTDQQNLQPSKRLFTPAKIQEIPPFQGSSPQTPVQASDPLQRGFMQSDTTPRLPLPSRRDITPRLPQPSIPQQPLPAFSPQDFKISQQPLHRPSPQGPSSSGQRRLPGLSSSPLPDPFHIDPKAEVTALTGVIVPAFHSALNRRAHAVSEELLNPQARGTQTAFEVAQRKQRVQDKVRKLAYKAAGILNELERWDREEPASMGGGVGSFLEGFLEEMLVRVDADDDEIRPFTPTRRR